MVCSAPGFPVLNRLPAFAQTLKSFVSVMPSDHLTLCRPLLLLPSVFPSIRIFSNESALPIRWPKYGSFSLSISPSVNIQGWFPLGLTCLISLQSKGLSRVFPQQYNLKASILWHSAFFTVQVLQPYVTTGKTLALTTWTFIGQVVTVLLNMLSRFVIAFLPRSTCLLISWLQSLSAMILSPPK